MATKRRLGDRKDGYLIHSLPALNRLAPYIIPNKEDAQSYYDESFNVDAVDKMLRKHRVEGYKNLSFMHFVIAAYIRCVSMLPGINRFCIGRRIYSRYNIEIVINVRRAFGIGATGTTVKVEFEPKDNIFDVYRKINAKIDEIKANDGISTTEDIADTLCHLPRFLLRFAVWLIRVLDYFGIVPSKLLNSSPYHGSMVISDMGALRISPQFNQIKNFGALPISISFGPKRHIHELDRKGEVTDHKYLDCKLSLDERICDASYYSQFILALRYIFQHPEILEVPPSRIVKDIQ